MKKKFITKKKKKKRFFKILIFFSLFVLGIYLSFRILLDSNIKIDNKEFIEILLNNSNHITKDSKTNKRILTKVIKTITNIDYTDPHTIIDSNYNKLVPVTKVNKKKETKELSPLIYIYNTHQTEEYAKTNIALYQVNPTVTMADYIMEDVFNKNNLPTIVEESSIKDILNLNGWRYYKSYDASKILMQQAKNNNPTLKYFIDVHRDSLTRDKTTIEIDNKSYAKTIFLIGLENPNYEANLSFTEKINNLMNEKYPGLSKGIYKKEGAGVNGVYNQDFSPYTILIEIGGQENTVDEVLNSSLAFTDCFMEVIKANEG